MRRAVTVVAAAVLVLALAAPAEAAPVIRGSGFSWSPARVRIAPGVTVRWRGVSGTHHLRAFGGNWTFDRALPVGTVVHRRFGRVGTYRFYCTIHGTVAAGRCTGMCGRVVVRR